MEGMTEAAVATPSAPCAMSSGWGGVPRSVVVSSDCEAGVASESGIIIGVEPETGVLAAVGGVAVCAAEADAMDGAPFEAAGEAMGSQYMVRARETMDNGCLSTQGWRIACCCPP